ncbi:hypothetical protein FE257_010807 [Aspergillus nanangensis]|uniref:F-box domain-containing protein n=1 Tax=Aspergillus nanangensis TaxID=2582783 RepID=A0AAD4CVJ6_ASPNN|nr:hypothetical protein FE257_010807 [Aspergillus nanangensis]
MSLPLNFLSASGHELSPLHTPDSRRLGSRPVCQHEVPTPATPSREDLIPVPPTPPAESPSSIRLSPSSPMAQFAAKATRHPLLPSAMTGLKLCMEWDGASFTPFSYFVAPELSPCAEQFPRFMDLPLEIHLMIFESCDTPSLFHLIHTSSYIRSKCLPLFWQFQDDIWYRPYHADRVVPFQSSGIYHCPEFASRITNVEIPVDFADHSLMTATARSFWEGLQDTFPSACNVVFVGLEPGELDAPDDDIDPYSVVYRLMANAPPKITALVAFLHPSMYGVNDQIHNGTLKHRLWRVEAKNWSLVEDRWTPMRVLLPRRIFPPGLLNDFFTSKWLSHLSWTEMHAINWLKLEIYAQYSTECPHPGCGLLDFGTINELKRHFSDHWHSGPLFTSSYELPLCHPNIPVEIKTVLDTKQHRVDQVRFIRTLLDEDLRDRYRKPGDVKLQFEQCIAAEMKQYNAPLRNAPPWGAPPPAFNYDYPEYPDQKDIDPLCPEEEHEGYDNAGEEYLKYPDYCA